MTRSLKFDEITNASSTLIPFIKPESGALTDYNIDLSIEGSLLIQQIHRHPTQRSLFGLYPLGGNDTDRAAGIRTCGRIRSGLIRQGLNKSTEQIALDIHIPAG